MGKKNKNKPIVSDEDVRTLSETLSMTSEVIRKGNEKEKEIDKAKGKGKGKGKNTRRSSSFSGASQSQKSESVSIGKGKKGKGKGKDKAKGKKLSHSSSREFEPEPQESLKSLPKETQPEVPYVVPCHEVLTPADPCNPAACSKGSIACRPNHYPGVLDEAAAMAIVDLECGTASFATFRKLLNNGFRCADRVFARTPWANYVIFKAENGEDIIYFLYDGCTCNVNRFRYIDLNCGTAGFVYLKDLGDAISYMFESRAVHETLNSMKKSVVDDLCSEFCEFGPKYRGGTT